MLICEFIAGKLMVIMRKGINAKAIFILKIQINIINKLL